MEADEVHIEAEVEQIRFQKVGPSFPQVLSDKVGRQNTVVSIEEPSQATEWKKKPHQFTEEEGLDDLAVFLNQVEDVAKLANDDKVLEEVGLFRENLVYIGEKELQEAVVGIAGHLVEKAVAGKTSYIYVAGIRSERYITLRVLEEFDRLTEADPKLREKLQVSRVIQAIAQGCMENPDDSTAIVIDDFAISGKGIRGAAQDVYRELVKSGMKSEQAADSVEACLVACTRRQEGTNYQLVSKEGEENKPLKVYSYYAVPEYHNSEGKRVVHPGVSLTGTHSSTDYGFENEIRRLRSYAKEQGVELEQPLLYGIDRPYKTVDDPEKNQFIDAELQKRWETVGNKYGVNPEEFKTT